VRAAEQHYEAGQLDLAAEHYRLTLDLDTDQLVALKGLATIELQQGNAPAALTLLERQALLSTSRGPATTALDLLVPLLELVPSDTGALLLASRLSFEQGPPARSIALHERLLQQHREALSTEELATATLRLGQTLTRTGSWQQAISPLEDAADQLPSAREPLDALVLAYTETGDWQGVLRTKERLLDLCDGNARADLLAEIAVITSDKLSNKSEAIRKLVAALEDKPDDRKLLTRLMGLYSDGKEWVKLLDVVAKLESLTDNPEQKIKYLLTLAMVCQRELHDNERALGFYERVLALDATHFKATTEALNLSLVLGKLDLTERLLNERLQRAQQANSHAELLAVFLQLGQLYKERLQRVDAAIDAFEAAQTLDPHNVACFQALDGLYATDLDRYRDRAIALHTAQLHNNPFTPEPYQQLRRLYTGLRRADPAWCLCRTLNALSLSSAEEDQFYERFRSDEAVALEAPLTAEDLQLLLHPDTDPLLTAIFSILEPVVLQLRATPVQSLGYDPQIAIDVEGSQHPGAQALLYVAGALAQPLPLAFHDNELGEPLKLLASEPPAVVMGAPFIDLHTPTQSLVFACARALCGLLPGLRLRHFLASGTGFKSWLLAAIRLNTPAFPIPTELVGPVEEAHAALREALAPHSREDLSRLIAKLLQEPSALDVKQWLAGVDYSADRVGLLLANDLRTAIEAIRAGSTELTALQASRIKELVLFSADERYFELRKRLGIAID
jgi:tetratricopeptide (TPR) repeat protein